MANRLPVISVVSLSDVEAIATHGAPRRFVLLRAESISEARAMLSVLRAKGILEVPHARAEGFDDFGLQADKLAEGSDSDSGGAASNLPEAAWDLDQGDSDFDLRLRLLLSDADSDEVEGGGAQQDSVACGWKVDYLPRFRRAIDLGLLLEEVTSRILPVLFDDTTSPAAHTAALGRLRNHATQIRLLGKQVPELMGQAPVTLANFLKRNVADALGRGTGAAAWMASRRDRILGRVLKLYDEERVVFADPDLD